MDYIVFKNVHKLLPYIKIVAKNKSIQQELKIFGANSTVYPVFPDTIIMARHALHKFPEKKIKKIGMRHGPYHFKEMIHPDKYNAFDLFLLTSSYEVEEAKQIGIRSAVSGGFPKLDDLFVPEIINKAQSLKKELFANVQSTLLFTATWEKSGLSAIEQWYDKLHLFTNQFNILVTVHPWVNKRYIDKISKTKGVKFIIAKDIAPYLLMADIMIADTSSIIAEFNALEKPIITFNIPSKGRLSEKIVKILEKISFRIDNIDELSTAINEALNNPTKNKAAQKYYNTVFFEQDMGQHSKLITNIINKFVSK